MPARAEDGQRLVVGEPGEDHLADRAAVQHHPAPHLGEHPHRVPRGHLRDVDGLVTVEHRQVGRLADVLDQPREVGTCDDGQHPLGALGEHQQLRAEDVCARRLLADVAQVDQRAQQPVDGRKRQSGLGGQSGQADHPSAVGHRLEELERALDGLHSARSRGREAGGVLGGLVDHGIALSVRACVQDVHFFFFFFFFFFLKIRRGQARVRVGPSRDGSSVFILTASGRRGYVSPPSGKFLSHRGKRRGGMLHRVGPHSSNSWPLQCAGARARGPGPTHHRPPQPRLLPPGSRAPGRAASKSSAPSTR